MNIEPSNPDPCPGEEEAQRLGYSLHSTNGGKTKANYTKDSLNLPATLHLTVSGQGKDQVAKLEAFIGLLTLSTGEFAFPHPNFAALFEKQMILSLRKLA